MAPAPVEPERTQRMTETETRPAAESGQATGTAGTLLDYGWSLLDRYPARFIAGALLIAVAVVAGTQLAAAESWVLCGGVAASVAIWLAGLVQRRDGFGSPMFILTSLCCLVGTTLGHLAPVTGLVCVVLLLAGWDLHHLAWRMLNLTGSIDPDAYLVRHLLRLGGMLATGLVLALIPLQFTFRLAFVPTLILAMACCALLFWALGGARKLSGGAPRDEPPPSP